MARPVRTTAPRTGRGGISSTDGRGRSRATRDSLAREPARDSGPAAILSYRAMWVAAGGLASASGKRDSARQGTGKEDEHGEGPHRARGLARRVHQWTERRP